MTPTDPGRLDETRPCCAHLTITYRTEPAGHGTVRGYWWCKDCERRFRIELEEAARAPRSPAPDAAAIEAAIDAHRDAAFRVANTAGHRAPDAARALDETRAALLALLSAPPPAAGSEAVRLRAVLERIDGGDHPCTDESKLRQWAYEALTLGRTAEELSR